MDFFVYSRVGAGAANIEHGPVLDEEHWSYMDRFADGMIARGPTLAADRATWTGSVHILDLPSVEAAHQFVQREPYNRAGLFDQHLIRRFKTCSREPCGSFPEVPMTLCSWSSRTRRPKEATRRPPCRFLTSQRWSLRA
jgi:hypothetical protein